MSPPNVSGESAPQPPSKGRAAPDLPVTTDPATRRLSDKILAAFNHAYAVGEFEVANLLRSALVAGEAKRAGVTDQRRGHDPLYQAELWVAFVEARNDYRGLCKTATQDAKTVETALTAMRDAYRRWSAI